MSRLSISDTYEPHDVSCAATAGTAKRETDVIALVSLDCFAQVDQPVMDDLLRVSKPYYGRTYQPTVTLR
jgi:hypothetical protein